MSPTDRCASARARSIAGVPARQPGVDEDEPVVGDDDVGVDESERDLKDAVGDLAHAAHPAGSGRDVPLDHEVDQRGVHSDRTGDPGRRGSSDHRGEMAGASR